MANRCSWRLADLPMVQQNGLTVMSTFSCGGGSSMGYKRAGCSVIAANDIDPDMARHYRRNLNPKHYFLCPVKDLVQAKLPDELSTLDILDGSPPCSTFSMAGSREDAWGVNKQFREGQAKQVLSDLFFDFLVLAEKLKPKVVIAENVKGLILGNAKGYVRMITDRLRALGYNPQVFLLNAADCGVPQRRERVFVCAVRGDISSKKLTLRPSSAWISASDACSDVQDLTPTELEDTKPIGSLKRFWADTLPGDSFAAASKRENGKESFFNNMRLAANVPSVTLTGKPHIASHWSEMRSLSIREWQRIGSFPDDYQFENHRIGKYMIGMSVPPKMTEFVASEVIRQWLQPA